MFKSSNVTPSHSVVPGELTNKVSNRSIGLFVLPYLLLSYPSFSVHVFTSSIASADTCKNTK